MSKTRRWIVIVVGGLAAVTALVVGGTYLYVNVITGDAPEPLTLDTVEPTEGATGPSGPSGTVGLDGTWVVADGSEAGYRVDEVLNGQDHTVAGRTSDVSGEVTVTGGSASAGEVTVDMTTLETDSRSRDGQFRGPIMDTDDFPTSAFTLTEPVPLDQLTTGGPISLSTSGELTIRDITRQVEVDLDLQLAGDNVQVAGSVPITFADFDVDPPNLGFVRVEDEGVVEFLLTLSRS